MLRKLREERTKNKIWKKKINFSCTIIVIWSNLNYFTFFKFHAPCIFLGTKQKINKINNNNKNQNQNQTVSVRLRGKILKKSSANSKVWTTTVSAMEAILTATWKFLGDLKLQKRSSRARGVFQIGGLLGCLLWRRA